jgi:hypothetical protein
MTDPNGGPRIILRRSLDIPPLPDLPKTLAVRRLTDALVSKGHHRHGAAAIARAVCDPSTVRRQLEQPGEWRVDGGYLQIVHTSVWTPAVIPHPTNARAIPAFAYRSEGRTDRRPRLPEAVASLDPDACELLLTADSTAELIAAIDLQLSFLQEHNDLLESVSAVGVREPLLLTPLVLQTSDVEQSIGEDAAPAVLSAVDGSSRIAAAYSAQGLEPYDVIFKLSNERLLRQRIQSVLYLLERDRQALDDSDLAQLRTIVVPAAIVVGFRPDKDSDADLSTAVASRVGSIHVSPPQAWSEASRLDVQVDAVIAQLLRFDKIDKDESEWLAGDLTSREAEAAGFSPHSDVRAAHLLHIMNRESLSIRTALRSVSTVSRVTRKLRISLAVEGSMRAFRSKLTEAQIRSARALLLALYSMDELKQPWTLEIPQSRTVGAVKNASLKEIKELGEPGPNVRELIALAAYWLARYRLVRPATRGGDTDRRDITNVLLQAAHTPHGVQMLVQIIVDGRRATRPRRVDPVGDMVLAADGTELMIDETWIRETWPSDQANSDSKKPEDPPLSPEAQLAARRAALLAKIAELTQGVDALAGPENVGGEAIIDSLGLPPSYVDRILSDLYRIQTRLIRFRVLGENSGYQ